MNDYPENRSDPKENRPVGHVSVQLQDQDDKTWITISDAADILNVNPQTVRWYAARGKFQRSGQGSGTRVRLGDVREYARARNPDRVAGGAFETALRARGELMDINDRLTILLTRKAELEEVIHAVETIERFARLKPEDEDVQNAE